MKEVLKILDDSRIRVISVDVFDTLLLRETKPEVQRFKEISECQANALKSIGQTSISVNDLYLLRREAARTAYTSRKPVFDAREANWSEILSLAFRSMKVPIRHEVLTACEIAEIDYECNHLTWNKQLGEILEYAKNSGKQVVCLSDMYLSSATISTLVDRVAGRDIGLKVYSSADYGFGKASGKMFEVLAGDLNVDLDEILHTGDNYHADYLVPKSLGVKAIYAPRTMLWRIVHKFRKFLFNRPMAAL